MVIARQNLIAALQEAIYSMEIEEHKAGHKTDSAKLAGWRKLLDALNKGENIEVR